MNILIDTTPLENQSAGRGIGRYTVELITALQRLGTSDHFFTSKDVQQTKIDLTHYPFFDLFFHTLPFFQKTASVVTIHDVTPLVFAKHYPPGIRGRIKFVAQKAALSRVNHIITDSLISKRDIIEKLHIQPDKITVVPLAASIEIRKPIQSVIDAVRKKYSLPKYYALYVGDINYNKNLPFLISAMRKVPKLTLVLVGKNVASTAIPEGRAIQKAIQISGVESKVRMLTEVSSESAQELSALYAGASVYVQPSLYEGFGLPVLEAMQCRTPVACSLGGSLPEVAGDNAIFFHPHDEEECAAAINKIVRMPDKQRSTLVQKALEWSAQFTWERTARETLAVYQRVVS